MAKRTKEALVLEKQQAVLKQACSCQGANPNCFKCGGWGYIDSISAGRISAGPAEASSRGVASKSRGARRRVTSAPQQHIASATLRTLEVPLERCPVCNRDTANLKEHLRLIHPNTRNPMPRPGFALCTHCGCHVKASKMQTHLREAHALAPIEAARLSKGHFQLAFVLCPQCGCRLKAARMERHIRKAHGAPTPTVVKRTSAKAKATSTKEIEQVKRRMKKAEQAEALKRRMQTPASYDRKSAKAISKAKPKKKKKKARSVWTISGGGFETNRRRH